MWRSLLFMPVLEERFLAKAAERGADAVVLDLEASIAPGRKDEAQAALPSAIERLRAQGQDVLVRINALWRPALKDLEYAVRAGVEAIVVPECESPEQLQAVDAYIGELEIERGLPQGSVRIAPIIESARGVRDVDGILRATERAVCVGFGIDHYLTDMGALPTREFLSMTSLAMAEAARAAGLAPLIVPESLTNLTDLDAFEAAAVRGRQMGSEGGFAAHPGQVERLNKVFTPTEEELVAEMEGKGAVRHEGRMIEAPIVMRAERLLARAKRFR